MSNRILAALVEARALLRSEGNPNHDDEGKFASAPGAKHGKHWAKKQRRKAKRKAKLEAIRKDYKGQAKDLKKEHRAERAALIKTQLKERTTKAKEHVKEKVEHRKYEATEKKTLLKEHKKTHRDLGREHGRELAHEDRQHEKTKTKIDATHAEGHAKLKAEQEPKAAKLAKSREQGRPHEGLEARLVKQTVVKGKRLDRQRESRHKDERERHEADVESLKESHVRQREDAKSDREFDRSVKRDEIKASRAALKEEHKDNWADLKAEHHDQREQMRDQHKSNREELVENLRGELESEGFSRKIHRDHEDKGHAERTSPGGIIRAAVDHRSFSSGRTHKASSAEAILRHCLRQRGWTGQYARGALTGRQRLRLLEDIRRYTRAWLRHEAEAFFRQYGVERGLAGAMARHVGRFFDRAKQFVHEAILAGSLAFFEPADNMTEDDMRHVDQEAQTQARYFDRFHQEVVSAPPLEIAEPMPIPAIAPMTAKQFVARAEQYGDAPWGAAQQVNRQRLVRGGVYIEERRIHGKLKDDMCEVCSKAVADGWQPIGTLPRIGDSPCQGNCHCYFQYADKDGNVATTVRKLRRKKKVA